MGKFAYTPSRMCVDTCPAPYYGYDTLILNLSVSVRTCELTCPDISFA